jgi:hypothetical protein
MLLIAAERDCGLYLAANGLWLIVAVPVASAAASVLIVSWLMESMSSGSKADSSASEEAAPWAGEEEAEEEGEGEGWDERREDAEGEDAAVLAVASAALRSNISC